MAFLPLGETGGGQGKVPREHSSVFMIQEVGPKGTETVNISCHLVQFYTPDASMKPISLSHLQIRKLKHKEIN